MVNEKEGVLIEEKLYEDAPDEVAAAERLFTIVRILRKLCPWDSIQTHDSLRICMLEEAYEAVDAIINEDMENLREELGDVMLQAVMNGIIAEESGTFTLTRMINDESEKMIRRHPHIFGDAAHKDVDKVLEKWENIKGKEHGDSTVSERLSGIPKALPALMRANKVMTKVQRADLIPENYLGETVESENVRELVARMIRSKSEELADRLLKDSTDMEKSIGDLLFLVTDAARITGVDPEAALNRRTQNYIDRFT